MVWKATWEQIAAGSLTSANCSICEGRGVCLLTRLEFGEGDEPVEVEQEAPCECLARPGELLERANLPPAGPLRQTMLAGLDWHVYPPDLAQKVQRYADRLTDYVPNGIGLTLIGNVGTGKTHIALGLVALACGLGIEARFVSMAELLARLRASYDQDDQRNGRQPREADILDEFGSVPFLALDDLGTGKPTAWVKDRFYFLINRRYMAGLPTVVTSNVTPAVLEDRLGQRVISRIWGTSITVVFKGGDYRKARKAALLAELS